MDLNTIAAVIGPRTRLELAGWTPGDGFLAGGTWLFSEPQPHLRRLVDLTPSAGRRCERQAERAADRRDLRHGGARGVDVPGAWLAAASFRQCCQALLGSFKIWNVATVGGNLCLALPAGPMIALDRGAGRGLPIWRRTAASASVAASDFVLGQRRTALRAGRDAARHRPAGRGAARADRLPADLAHAARAGRPRC